MKLGALLLFLFTLLPLEAKIQQITSFEEITPFLRLLPASSLVVFDVDCVLIEHEDAILQAPNRKLLNQLLTKQAKLLTPARLEELMSVIYLEANKELIEPEIVPLIAFLQEQNIDVIGLTATKIGGIGKVESIQQWRINDLKRHNIEFTRHCNEAFSFNHLSNFGPSPVYEEGILFSGDYPKGTVLKAYLELIGKKPHTVVFIDDLYHNNQSVEQEMKQFGVENRYCFHYAGAEIVQKLAHPLIAEEQLTHLITHGKWLRDKELMSRLQNSGSGDF